MIQGDDITAKYVQDLRALCNRLESENKYLRNRIKGIIFMAADGVGGYYPKPVKLFEDIRDEARAALRGEGGQSQGIVETFDQLREAIGHYFDDIDDVEKYVNEELRGEGGEDGSATTPEV